MHLVCCTAKFFIEINIHRVCTLIWCCNAHTCVQNIQVALWQIVRCSTVNKYRIQRLLFFYKLDNIINILIWVEREVWLFHLVAPVAQIKSLFIQKHTVDCCNTKNLNINIFFQQLLALVADLVNHCSTNCSRTKGKYFDCLSSMEEELMNSTNSSISIFIFDNGRNTAFAASLSNCQNINILTRKSVEELTCNTAVSNHAISDNAYNSAVLANINCVNQFFADFKLELCFKSVFYKVCLCITNTERNCIFRRRLSNQKNRAAGRRYSRENLTCHTSAAAHKRTAHTNHAYMLKRRNTADTRLAAAFKRSLSNAGTAGTRIMAVQAPGFNSLCLERSDCFWMKNFRTKEWKLHCFFIRHIINKNCIFYNARVCCVNSVYISPEFNTLYAKAGTNNCGRKVGTVTAQKSHNRFCSSSARPCTDKAWEEEDSCLLRWSTIAERCTCFITSWIISFPFLLISRSKYKFSRIQEDYTLLFCQ